MNGQPNMRLFELDSRIKKRIKSAIDKLDDKNPEDRQMLDYLKSNLFNRNLQSTLDTSGLANKVRDAAYQWFVSKLETLKVPLEEKVHLLKLMQDSSNLIPAATFQSNVSGNILNYLGPRIKNNKAFKALVTPTWQFKIGGQGGMGPGELFLILFSENGMESTGKKSGDLQVNDWTIELKNGGVVPPGDSGKKVVDNLNKGLMDAAKAEGFANQLDSKSRTSFDGGWLPHFFKLYASKKGDQAAKDMFSTYLNTLYDGIPGTLVDKAYSQLGSPGTEKLIAPYIFYMYQQSHQWNSICLVDNNFKFINLVTFDDLPADVGVKLSLKRGGDTNAVADGYALVFLGKDPDGAKEAKKTAKAEAKPKKTKAVKPANPELFDEPTLDPAAQQQAMQAKQNVISADDKFLAALKDPSNPISVAWKTIPSEDKADAKDIILDLIMSGISDEEVAAEIKNGLFEHRLRRLKTLISH